ncbi:flagellar protein FlgN [Methylobacterium sp. J-070]|uniref:flagellar protein FlgN n=1 Tax=Methylobacterium sp. J-070 TaxID=2836650 RepID=UPI001FB8A365|nr:flagellar protein FlgN [Methylobacterium sp. J-070]MCJ2048323.1 flagellar protein FlgN [Methylobacterium sp. J-070]
MLLSSLSRLESIIDAETAALAAHDLREQDEFNRRKSQSLVELARLGRAVDGTQLSPPEIDCLERLRGKLRRNHELLGIQLRAMQEVSDIVSTMIQSAESDGTYSAALRFQE